MKGSLNRMNFIKRHFKWLSNQEAKTFIIYVTVEFCAIGLFCNFAISSIVENTNSFKSFGNQFSFFQLAIIGIFLAPIYETFFLQQIPILLVRKFKLNLIFQFLISVFIFAICHSEHGFIHAITSGIMGGGYLAFSYLVFLRHSVLKAFFVTATIHMLVNAIMLFLLSVNI